MARPRFGKVTESGGKILASPVNCQHNDRHTRNDWHTLLGHVAIYRLLRWSFQTLLQEEAIWLSKTKGDFIRHLTPHEPYTLAVGDYKPRQLISARAMPYSTALTPDFELSRGLTDRNQKSVVGINSFERLIARQ